MMGWYPGSRPETEIIGFAGRRAQTGSRAKWISQTMHQKSNYIILLQNHVSHMPRISRAIHAVWHKNKNQRERNSPELRKSNFETTGWCLLFTLKKESASKSVNCFQKGSLYTGNSVVKKEILSRYFSSNCKIAWSHAKNLGILNSCCKNNSNCKIGIEEKG